MSLTKKVLPALVGLGLLAMPLSALAADHYHRNAAPQPFSWRAPLNHAPFAVAQDNDHHGDHHDWEHDQGEHDWDHGHGDHHDWDHGQDHPEARADWQHHEHDADDYNWGGRNHYEYPPSYFSQAAPNGYNMSQRRAYLLQQRDKAEHMMTEMRARGDQGAENRLAGTIANINTQLRHTY